MPIIRIAKRPRFTAVSNAILEDTHLSLKAKGLLCYLLSKPDDWTVYVSQLAKLSPCDGRESIHSALRELLKTGYATFEQPRENGHFAEGGWSIHESPRAVFPYTGKPYTGKPDTGNPPLLKTEEEVKTEEREEDFHKNESLLGTGLSSIPRLVVSVAEPLPHMAVKKKPHKPIIPISPDDWPGLREILEKSGLPLSALDDNDWWNNISWTCNDPSNEWLQAQFAKMDAWIKENPHKAPRSRWKTFVRGWLERSYEYERKRHG